MLDFFPFKKLPMKYKKLLFHIKTIKNSKGNFVVREDLSYHRSLS